MGTPIKRRKVFYLPGYDPVHPRKYREMYRREGALQAGISGYDLHLSPLKAAKGRYGWQVDAQMDGQKTHTEFEVLIWSDIVRDTMETGITGTYVQLVRTAWIYIASGTLRRLMWLRKGPVIAALYPIVLLILQMIIALCLAGLTAWVLVQITPWIAPLAVAVIAPILILFRRYDNRLYAYYLMHDYAYSAQHRGANPPDLARRMGEFTADISAALNSDQWDEVLVVGHSSGAHLGVMILADMLRRETPQTPLGFLTLGHVVPMVSFLPDAWELRRDLVFLSTQTGLFWMDVTAPGDGCAFALCDPVAVSGVAPEGQKWPLVISAAFSQTLKPETWARLRRRYFRLHFQYLHAFDQPGDYDYFAITAGPVALATRYKSRAPSQSRITIAASKFTSVAP